MPGIIRKGKDKKSIRKAGEQEENQFFLLSCLPY
jgi:hypothetical protein